MPTTPTYALRYPAATDPADVPTDMGELATDVEAALNGKQATAAKGTANGYASLDSGGKVPVAQLPASVSGQTLTGTYAARPAANSVTAGTIYYAIDTQGAFFSDGATWTLVQQGEAAINAGDLANPPWSTPYDGMRIRYAVDTTLGIFWSFKYRAASASGFKWEFCGGPWQKVYLAGYNALVCDSAWHNIGFGIVAGRGGDYAVRWSGSVYSTTAVAGSVYASVALGTGSIVGANGGSGAQVTFTPLAGQIWQASYDQHVANVLAGQAIYEIYLASSGMNVQIGNRSLSIQPIRIA